MQHEVSENLALHHTASETRQRDAAAVATELLRQWERGVSTVDADTIAAHPDLMPELAEQLKHARIIRSALLAARKAGPAAESSRLRLLSDEEIESPIEFPGDRASLEPSVEPLPDVRPRIPGYVLMDQLSVGGQALVYKAVQESTGRTVAVKLLSRDSLSDSRHRTRFEREAEILARLRHPHVVNILDRGRTSEGDFYILMEFVDGLNFDEWCDTLPDGTDGAQKLLENFVKICRAVNEAHSRGIVHRDIKPSNIRIDIRGEPRVLDFGLARPAWSSRVRPIAPAAARAATINGQLLGSIPWTSPEQAAGDCESIDARSDVYSLGVVLYQALTGHFPYAVDGPLYQVLDSIARTPAPALCSTSGARCFGSRGLLDAIVGKTLAKDPAQRYTSAGALADDLDHLLVGRPICAVPRKPWWRNLRVTSIAVLLLVIAGGATWHYLRPPTAPVVFELPSITNSVGMRLVRVPAGVYLMGSPAREVGHRPNEAKRQVEVRDFYVATLEVTQRQYEMVMSAAPSEQKWRHPDFPVHNLSWDEASEFCRRLSAAEGRTYRLPTEAEWEYACRAGSKGAFFSPNEPRRVAWFSENSGGQIHRGGGKWPNSWGLYDTHGNVREWCSDPLAKISRPDFVVVRGGSALLPAEACRAAATATVSPNTRSEDLGFRVVLDSAD